MTTTLAMRSAEPWEGKADSISIKFAHGRLRIRVDSCRIESGRLYILNQPNSSGKRTRLGRAYCRLNSFDAGKLAALGVEVWPTDANFLLARTGADLHERLLREGVIVPAHVRRLDSLRPMDLDYDTLAPLLEGLSRGFLKRWVDRNL